jgi:hypothetical protein
MSAARTPPTPPPGAAGAHGRLRLDLQATVLDIGLSGIAIESDTRLTPQGTLELRLASADEEIALLGRVVWCFFHGTASAPAGEQVPVYRAGIEFSDVLTPRAAALVQFLEANAAVSGETRLFGRFRLPEAGPVTICSDTPFRLVGLDGGTATVETELGLEPFAGSPVTLRLEDHAAPLRATVADARRSGDGRESWQVTLLLDAPDPEALSRLHALRPA